MEFEDSKIKTSKWSTIIFFVLAYVWSWAWWLPVVLKLRSQDADMSNIPGWIVPFVLIGGYGPSVAAVIMTALTTGRPGIKKLFSRFLLWRAPAMVHVAVWLGPSAFLCIAMLLDPTSTALLGKLDWTGFQLIPMVILSGLAFGPLGEELGWRGYALPALQKKHTALSSSLIVGVAWCLWHAPLFWAPAGTLISGQEVTIVAIAKYLLFACGLAIVFTWIFNNSRGSVLLSVLFHAIINASIPFLFFPLRDPDAALTIQWYSIIPVWFLAALLVAVYGRRHLSKEPVANRN